MGLAQIAKPLPGPESTINRGDESAIPAGLPIMNDRPSDLRGYLAQLSTRRKTIRKAADVLTEVGALCSQSSDPLGAY